MDKIYRLSNFGDKMENVTENPCNEHYSHRCVDCEHCKETTIRFQEGIFSVEMDGFHCTKYDIYSGTDEFKRTPVYDSDVVTGKMAMKNISLVMKSDVEYPIRLRINGVTIHLKNLNFEPTDKGLKVNGYLHALTYSGGICYEDGQPLPPVPSFYNIGISEVEVVDKRCIIMHLPNGHKFFNDWTCCYLHLGVSEVWIDFTEEWGDNE